jgi:type III secretory pathway lipoprotein EscJ
MRKLLLLMIVLLLAGCKTKYIPVEVKTTETVKVHDTVVVVKLVVYHDSVSVRDTSNYLKNEYCETYANWENGVLHHSLNTLKDAHVEVVTQIKEIEKEVEKPTYIEVEKEVEVEKSLTLFEKICMNLGKVTIFALIILIVYLLTKGGYLGKIRKWVGL